MFKETTSIITKQVINLLREKFMILETCLSTDQWDTPLTGFDLNLSGVDMVYLFFELEKLFQVRIDEQYLTSYKFSTINQIAQVMVEIIENEKRKGG